MPSSSMIDHRTKGAVEALRLPASISDVVNRSLSIDEGVVVQPAPS